MKQRDAYGKVLGLTKRIYLYAPSPEARFSRFFIGPRNRIGTFGMEWWTTWDTTLVLEDLVVALMQSNSSLEGGDTDSFKEEILTTLKELVADRTFFNTWAVISHEVPTLFDAIAPSDKLLAAKELFLRFGKACSQSVCDWLVIYPLHRIQAPTTSLGFNGLSLVSADDAAFWSSFHKSYPSSEEFDIRSGRWPRDPSGPSITMNRSVPTWLVCVQKGTADGARRKVSRHIRNFLSLLLCVARDTNPSVLLKTGWEPSTYSIQFAEKTQGGWECAWIGRLLPPIGTDFDIQSSQIDELRSWHLDREKAAPEPARRAVTASEFCHQAMIENETEQFVHLFITLDALFGERWKVESGIVRGVRLCFPNDDSWADRCRRLFDLRSELVHGEISSISDWSGLSNYRRHFRSQPLGDTMTLVTRALRGFFRLPNPVANALTYEI